MPEMAAAEWGSWAFWARDPSNIRDLVFILAVLVGVPFLVWREALHHRQTKAALQQAATAERRHDSQVEADRERRINDNFARAVDSLGVTAWKPAWTRSMSLSALLRKVPRLLGFYGDPDNIRP